LVNEFGSGLTKTERDNMTTTESRAWVVRGGSKGESDQRFLAGNLVGIGFREFGDLSHVDSREAMKAKALAVLPNAKPASAGNYAAQARNCGPSSGPASLV
jgi:hypothetical protein